jgi:hypothetical protein
MDPLERAACLRAEADTLLDAVGVFDILGRYSRIYPTGSYFLNLMAYPDIDLMIDRVPVETMFMIGSRIACSEHVFEVKFEKAGQNDPLVANGLYLKPRILWGDWGRPWKIDVWSLDYPLIERKLIEMHRFQSLLTPTLRERILNYKTAHLTPEGRTPMYSGYFIYKAVLEEGLTEDEEISAYLRMHGIQI